MVEMVVLVEMVIWGAVVIGKSEMNGTAQWLCFLRNVGGGSF